MSSDPFVIVSVGEREIHRTKVIFTTCVPTWRMETADSARSLTLFARRLDQMWMLEVGSVFLLEVTAQELFEHAEGIIFHVMDYNTLKSNISLGFASVPPEALYNRNGEQQELDIKPMLGLQRGKVSRDDIMLMH